MGALGLCNVSCFLTPWCAVPKCSNDKPVPDGDREIQSVVPCGSQPQARLLHGELIVKGGLELERLNVCGF